MTQLDMPRSQLSTGGSPESARRLQDWQSSEQASEAPPVNVGDGERAVSTAAGAVLAALGLSRFSLPGLLVAGVGGALIYRGMTGHCSLYASLGLDTSHELGEDAEEELAERGVRVEQVFLINRSAAELYQYWRNFSNLPNIMSHLKSVTVGEGGRSHWVAKAPAIAGGKVEWDAEITDDETDALIAWRSLPGSDVDCAGRVTFSRALGDRGTEVRVSMSYIPPAGKLGDWIAKLFGKSAKQQIREDLRTFKRVMEVGEAPTIEGQSRGTCVSGAAED